MADNFNHFQAIADALPGVLSQAVKKTAIDAKSNIQAHIITNGQVDTGFMLNSVYTVTSNSSDYSGGEKAFPEIDGPSDDQTAYVAVAAEYAAPQNYGTSHMVGRSFFEPGVDEARVSLEAAMSAIAKKLGETQ